ncbi:MAG: TraR/DksA family transcriptional regulator [Spirochaetota bacterium]
MDKRFRERMSRNLRELEREIVERLNIEYDSLQNIMPSSAGKDQLDLAEEHVDRETLELLGERDRNRLSRISAAIRRINTSGYGRCQQCGRRISKKRLEAMPDAVLCFECKNAREQNGRRWTAVTR